MIFNKHRIIIVNYECSSRPEVGVGLLIVKNDKILLGKRLASHGTGSYGGPGGHLELGESFEDCITREVTEEAGANIRFRNLRFLCLTNMIKYSKHYVDIGMIAEYDSGEPEVAEPDKLESWNWYDIDQPPTPLFGCVKNYIKAYKIGKVEFEKA